MPLGRYNLARLVYAGYPNSWSCVFAVIVYSLAQLFFNSSLLYT
jgi:hypothetical protein